MVQGGKREIYTAVGVIQHPDKGAENQKQMRLNPMEYNTYVYEQSLSLFTPLLERGKCWGKSNLRRAGYKL